MRILTDNRPTLLRKSLGCHVLHKSARIPAILLDIVDCVVIPFFFGVLVIDLQETDGNRG